MWKCYVLCLHFNVGVSISGKQKNNISTIRATTIIDTMGICLQGLVDTILFSL